MAGVVADLRDELVRRSLGDLAAVGVGVAGLVDRAGVLRFAPNLPGVVDLDVQGALGRRHGPAGRRRQRRQRARRWPSTASGPATGPTTWCWSPWAPASVGASSSGGVLQRGAAGFAGEPGHMVVDPNGPPCPCGRRGCWERYASGSGLGRIARDAAHAGRADSIVALAGGDPDAVRGEHVTRAAADGDAEAVELMREFAWWVALGVSNLENLLDPGVVVIGGGLAEAGELLLAPDPRRLRRPGAGPRPPAAGPHRRRRAGCRRRCHRVGAAGRRPAAPKGPEPDPDGLTGRATVAGMEFRRINSLPPYVFTIIDSLKVEARRAGIDVIDLGFGNPDLPSPDGRGRQAGRGGAQHPEPPLLVQQGHPEAAPGRRRPLPAALRRRASIPTPRSSTPSVPRRASPT